MGNANSWSHFHARPNASYKKVNSLNLKIILMLRENLELNRHNTSQEGPKLQPFYILALWLYLVIKRAGWKLMFELYQHFLLERLSL